LPCLYIKWRSRANQYDAYGNLTRVDDAGDADQLGDETATVLGYYPNTTAYIVDRVGYENRYSGAVAVKSTGYAYDGQADFTVAPTHGSVTKRMEWYGEQSRWVWTQLDYDAYGNLTKVTDPTGRWTRTIYDTSYHVFPVSVDNSSGEPPETTTWDPIC